MSINLINRCGFIVYNWKIFESSQFNNNWNNFWQKTYCIYCVNYRKNRRSGHYVPILLAPVEGWGALWAPTALLAILGDLQPPLHYNEIIFWIRIPIFGCFFYKTFWFEASLNMFLIFWNFRGSFWVQLLVFENFKIVFWIRIPNFGGSVF